MRTCDRLTCVIQQSEPHNLCVLQLNRVLKIGEIFLEHYSIP